MSLISDLFKYDWIGEANQFVKDFYSDPWHGVSRIWDWAWHKPLGYTQDLLYPQPAIPSVPDRIGNTIGEGFFVSRCYGLCKIGGNKIRFNAASDTDLRIIVAHCMGEVQGISTWYVNDLEWSTLTGTHTKTEYTGTRTQTADARFSSRASAYRSIAYTAFTFSKNDQQVGHDPNITVIMQGLKCLPLAGGAPAFTANPAVILYDWYLNVEGYTAGSLNLNAFKSLEALCDQIPSGSVSNRYRFDYNFDLNLTLNDAKKLIWQSFNGRVIQSQGTLKPVWDSGQMANGSGGLTAKTVSHAFTEDNIVEGTLTWKQAERPNLVRIHYLDSNRNYMKTSVEEKDQRDIDLNGEIIFEEECWFITVPELARRRCKFKFNKFKYTDYVAELSAFSGASDLEVLDLVTVTHQLPGWTAKQFLVTQKSEDAYGRPKFILEAYYSGIYDDAQVATQASYESNLPNPYDLPGASTGITATLVSPGIGFDYDSVKVTFTPPAGDPFYKETEIYVSNDNITYYLAGTSTGGSFVIQGMGMFYVPGDTCYVKLRNVNQMGVKAAMPGSPSASVVITSSIRLGSFYAGLYDFWGGNAAIGNAATKIVIGNLDGVPKIALGPTADAITYAGTQPGVFIDGDGYFRLGGSTHGLRFDPSTGVLDVPTKVKVGGATYIDIDGANARIRSSDYVSGAMGAGFTLEPGLLEVGNIAARGMIRTAVFQKDVVSAVGGNLMVSQADVLATDMTAADASTLTISGEESFAVGDILRIKAETDDEWLEVTNIGSAPTYTVTRDKAGSYGANANPAWKKGATVVDYGASGDGAVYMTASETNAPYLSVVTHAGSPWSALTTRLRVGNLNGFLGYVSNLYGIAIGEINAYLKYDPTNGLQVKGSITVTGGELNADYMTAGHLRALSYMTQGSYLTSATALNDTTINLRNTTDFPSSGGGFFVDTTNDGNAFSYTGKTATTLTGCSGVQVHNNTALVIPSAKSLAINNTVNEFRFWGDIGTGNSAMLASIGLRYDGADYIVGTFGATITGCSRIGVVGASGSNIGVKGESLTGYAGYFAIPSDTHTSGPLKLSCHEDSSDPSHTASKGTFWVTSDATFWININGSTSWKRFLREDNPAWIDLNDGGDTTNHKHYNYRTVGTYSGDSSANKAIAHSLGISPQIVFIMVGDGRTLIVFPNQGFVSPMNGGTGYSVTQGNATYFYVGNASEYYWSGNASGSSYVWHAFV